MRSDDIQSQAEQALKLAKTDFAAAEQWLTKLLPYAHAADQKADIDHRYNLAIMLDALANLYALKAAKYWIALVDELGGPESIGTCWTCQSFADYCGKKTGLGGFE